MQFKNLLSLLQKRFLATSATLATTSTSQPNPTFAVQFLVNSCGLPLELALAASKSLKLDQNNAQKPQSVLSLLKSHQFDDTQIANLISKRPSILQSKIHSNLSPKLQFFVENGFAGDLLPKLIMSNPDILGRSLVSHIKPTYEFLKKFLKTEERVVASVNRASWLLTSDPKSKLLPNMEILMREGVPEKTVIQLLLSHPRKLMQKVERMVLCIEAVMLCFSIDRRIRPRYHVLKVLVPTGLIKHDNKPAWVFQRSETAFLNNFVFKYAETQLLELGFQPSSAMFTEAVRIVASMTNSTCKKEMDTFKELGWSENDIIFAFMRCPICLAYSEVKLRRAMETYGGGVGRYISTPRLINFSIERRVLQRYQVLTALFSKGLIEHDNIHLWVFYQSETAFSDNYVFKYVDEFHVCWKCKMLPKQRQFDDDI